MNTKKIDRDLLIKAILKRDKQGIILLTGETDSQIFQFYTADVNVNLGLNDEIEYNQQGEYFDSKGNAWSYQQLKAFEVKSRERTTKLQILPDLICIQLCDPKTLPERINKLKEDAKAIN